jgi:hypothetical protein
MYVDFRRPGASAQDLENCLLCRRSPCSPQLELLGLTKRAVEDLVQDHSVAQAIIRLRQLGHSGLEVGVVKCAEPFCDERENDDHLASFRLAEK